MRTTRISAARAPKSADFTPSNDLIGNPDRLRSRLREDGYLYLQGCVNSGALQTARSDVLSALHGLGWVVSDKSQLPCANANIYPGEAAYWKGLEAMLRLPSLYALKRDTGLTSVLGDLFGMPFFAHPRTVPRIAFPTTGEGFYESPAHQDYPYGQGALDTLTVWIPLDGSSRANGSLEIMAGSHRSGSREIFGGTEYRCAATSVDAASAAWRGGDLSPGDVLVFTSLTVHRARPNTSEKIRLSADVRFQPVASPLCASALEPAFYPKLPDWSVLLPEDQRESRVPENVRMVPSVPPEEVELPEVCRAFPWLIPSN
ncbi:phytanoyl-CoA dioxygenase family protein [Streptomyces sp. LZ34]